jgi:hypothetical protein
MQATLAKERANHAADLQEAMKLAATAELDAADLERRLKDDEGAAQHADKVSVLQGSKCLFGVGGGPRA